MPDANKINEETVIEVTTSQAVFERFNRAGAEDVLSLPATESVNMVYINYAVKVQERNCQAE